MPQEGSCGPELLRDQFGMLRFEWEGDEGVDFHIPHGEMLALLRDTGFEVEALHELRAPEGEDPDEVRFYVGRAWSRRWPSEDVWVARKR